MHNRTETRIADELFSTGKAMNVTNRGEESSVSQVGKIERRQSNMPAGLML
jgi:hypothetical protein